MALCIHHSLSCHSLQIEAVNYLYRDNTTTSTKHRYSSKPSTASPTPRKYTPCAMPKRGAMTRARHVAPFRNAAGPSRLMMRLRKNTNRTKMLQGSTLKYINSVNVLLLTQNRTVCSQWFPCTCLLLHLFARSADESLSLDRHLKGRMHCHYTYSKITVSLSKQQTVTIAAWREMLTCILKGKFTQKWEFTHHLLSPVPDGKSSEVFHWTFLEPHSKTVSQHSPKKLK